MNDILEELRACRAAATGNDTTIRLTTLEIAIAEIEHLRGIAGAVSKGASLADIRATLNSGEREA